MIIPITKSARKYGYLIWADRRDFELVDKLQGLESVNVFLNGLNLGFKRIDWKYNRISIGYKFSRALPDLTKYFDVQVERNTIKVECK